MRDPDPPFGVETALELRRIRERTDGGRDDVDEQPELAKRYKVMSIPTLIVFKNGEIVNQSVGVIPKGKMLEMLK